MPTSFFTNILKVSHIKPQALTGVGTVLGASASIHILTQTPSLAAKSLHLLCRNLIARFLKKGKQNSQF